MTLSLRSQLLLLVSIPLLGAAVFWGIGVVSLGRDELDLRFIGRELDLVGDLVRLRQATLAEQRDTLNLFLDPLAQANYREQTDESITALRRARQAAAKIGVARSFGAETDSVLTAALTGAERLTEARDVFGAARSGDDPFAPAAVRARAMYNAVNEQLAEAINRLNLNVDVVPLRARLDGIYWFGKLALAAELERAEIERAYRQQPPTIATVIRLQMATNDRRRAESNVVLLAPRELLEFWDDFLTEPVYRRAPMLVEAIFSPTATFTTTLAPEHHAEWSMVAQKRNELLDTVEPRLLSEARSYLETRVGALNRQLWRSVSVFAGLFVAAWLVAALFIARIQGLLRTAFRRLDEGLRAVAESTAGLRAGAERLAEGATSEAAGLERTHRSLGALTSGNESVVKTAEQTVASMAQTATLVQNSRQAMEAVTSTMNAITESSDATFRVVKTIDEIAFKTNLLAFNASIEAATAGEAGSGFSVVAEEVRQLAKRASEATAETARLVEDAHAAIVSGASLNAEVDHALRDVDANARRAGDLMRNIHTASSQMLQGMQQIGAGNRSMEAVTRQNAAIADHNASTAASLAEETDRLNTTIRDLERRLMGAR